MADFWHECFDPAMQVPPKEFERTFCRVCRNQKCERSAGSKDKWVNRMATQVDRLLANPKFADPDDPRYQDIRATDFPSALREAMRLEISDRKNDWTVPSEEDARALAVKMTAQPGRPAAEPEPPVEPPQPVEDDEPLGTVLRSYDIRGGGGEVYKVQLVEMIVGKPTWSCTCKAFQFGRARPCKHVEYAASLPPEDPPEAPEAPAPAPPPAARPPTRFQAEDPPAKPALPTPQAPPPARQERAPRPPNRPFFPTQPNIPMPSGGVMVDGSAPPPPKDRPDTRAPAQRPTATKQVVDPWAVPASKKPANVVPVGGRIVMGGDKEKK